MQFFKKFVAVLFACGSLLFANPSLAVTYVCVESTLGTFCMEMLEEDAPQTVANFLNYVRDGDFDKTFIHRTVPNGLIQGGGYKYEPFPDPVPEDAQVPNEFKQSNVRGTVAMAKLGDQPDSATNQWFVNAGDNTQLDTLNGGFTVFAKIVSGMSVVDAIANAQRVDLTASLGAAFSEVPVTDVDADGVGVEDLMQLRRVYLTDVIPLDPADPYACTADWVQTIAPTRACMDTTLGSFCIDLTPDVAPQTVANFLHYVADGDYNNSFFHRNVKDFVVQGGGYKLQPLFLPVPTDPVVANQFNVSNTRGTVAMARTGGVVDSASSQWFVNVKDNTELDAVDGGFTVFGRINDEGMAVIDAINALPIWWLNNQDDQFPQFQEVPLLRDNIAGDLNLGDFVKITNAYIPDVGPNPCFPVKPAALTELVSDGVAQKFEVPVRFGADMYHMIFTRELNLGNIIAFKVDVNKIRSVVDVGQEAATYTPDTGLMVIPSVLVNGNDVVSNVILRLTDPATLQFTVESYVP